MAESVANPDDGYVEVTGDQENICESCRKTKKVDIDAPWFCKTCLQYQCQNCADKNRGHELVDSTKIHLEKTSFDMAVIEKCDLHNKRFKVLCVDHGKLCCSVCTLERHRNCSDVRALSKNTEIPNQTISDLKSEIQNLQRSIDHFIGLINAAKQSLPGKLETALRSVDEIKSAFVKECDRIKLDLTARHLSSQHMMSEKFTTNINAFHNINDDLHRKSQCLSKNYGSQELACTIQKHVSLYSKTFEEKRENLCTLDYSLQYNDVLVKMLNSSISPSTVHTNKLPIDPSVPAVENEFQLDLFKSVDLKQCQDDTHVPLYTGLDFFTDGRLAVVDNKNMKLYIMDEILERMGMFVFSSHRLAVCVISEEEVAVTSGGYYLLEFLHVSKTNDITLTRTVKTTAKFWSICLMNETTFLVSTYDDKRPLRMITLTGEEKDFDNLPEKQYKIDGSTSTYIRNKDIAVLNDRVENTVYMYYIREKGFPGRVVKHNDIKEPRGVCVGRDDCLFVCCRHTHSIVQVSPSGKEVATHKLDMKYPAAVCVSKDGRRMAVSNTAIGKRKLQLFYIHI